MACDKEREKEKESQNVISGFFFFENFLHSNSQSSVIWGSKEWNKEMAFIRVTLLDIQFQFLKQKMQKKMRIYYWHEWHDMCMRNTFFVFIMQKFQFSLFFSFSLKHVSITHVHMLNAFKWNEMNVSVFIKWMNELNWYVRNCIRVSLYQLFISVDTSASAIFAS